MKKTFIALAGFLLVSAAPKGIERPVVKFQYSDYTTPTIQAYDSLAVTFEGLEQKLNRLP